MGMISTGVPHRDNGLQFSLVLDEQVHFAAARRLTQRILRVSSQHGPKLSPTSFIAWANGSKRATVTFTNELTDEELKSALRIMCSRLISNGYLDVMPHLPDPLWIEG